MEQYPSVNSRSPNSDSLKTGALTETGGYAGTNVSTWFLGWGGNSSLGIADMQEGAGSEFGRLRLRPFGETSAQCLAVLGHVVSVILRVG